MRKLHSAKEYVKECFDNDIFTAIQRYVETNYESLSLYSERVAKIDEIELYDTEIKSVRVFDGEKATIKFSIIVAATIVLRGHYHSDMYEDSTEKWFMLSCVGDLAKNLKDFCVTNVEEYNSKSNDKNPMSDSLVPLYSNPDYDKVAARILNKYFPEALKNPIRIDPEELAKKIGLNVLYRSISADQSVFGQIFFIGGEAELYDVKTQNIIKEKIAPKTMLIDKNASFLRSYGTVNATIVHECVHYILHKKAFAFARLFNREITRIRCLVDGSVQEALVDQNTTDRMEYQANTLAPKILMPYRTFKRKAEELIEKCKIKFDQTETIDVLEYVISDLADFYGVSRLSAKIRMIEVGYEEAVGAFTYIDGKYVKPHKYKKGAITRNQTFSIGLSDAVILTLTNPALYEKCCSGRYSYVDSHFVLNSPEYITEDERGYKQLTDYARHHIDECCLYFDIDVSKSSAGKENYRSICVLNRDIKTPIQHTLSFHNGYENSSKEKQAKCLQKAIEDEEKLYQMMTNNYLECLKKCKEYRKAKFDDMAEEILMSERQIRRIFDGDSDGKIETLAIICLALHLPPQVSFHIIEHSPLSFKQGNNEHLLFQFALRHWYGHPMAQIREQLQANGIQI